MALELLKLPIVRLARRPTRQLRVRDEPVVQRPLRAGDRVTFGQGGNAQRYMFGDDWHAAEARFRWVNRSAARLAFNALFRDPVVLKVDLQLMSERSWSDLQFAVTLNGTMLTIDRDADQPSSIHARIDGLLKPAHEMNILIFYSTLVRVSDLVGGADARTIGVGLRQLQFAADARQGEADVALSSAGAAERDSRAVSDDDAIGSSSHL